MTDQPSRHLLRASAIAALPERRHVHQFNDNAVRLSRGERNAVDAVHCPRIRRTMHKAHGRRQWVDWDHLNPLS
jgi:hypothetical protein